MSHSPHGITCSGAKCWLSCTAMPAQCKNLPPDEGGAHAMEGSEAHRLAYESLVKNRPIDMDALDLVSTADVPSVQLYVDKVRDLSVDAQYAAYETRLSLTDILGIPDAVGTADAIIVRHGTLWVIDLKFGRGVPVSPEYNAQLSLYALAALEMVEMLGYEINTVVLGIHQVRLDPELQTWQTTPAELLEFREIARGHAQQAYRYYMDGSAPVEAYHPSDETCRWCRAKATCPALAGAVGAAVTEDFESLDIPKPALPVPPDSTALAAKLGAWLPQLDLVEQWCDAIRVKARELLMAGTEVPGYKLVTGRAGNRAWADETKAEAILKSMRLLQEQMYTRKVISPTAAEKLLAKESPRRWDRLQSLVVRKAPELVVTPASDKRPAVIPTSVEFECLDKPE